MEEYQAYEIDANDDEAKLNRIFMSLHSPDLTRILHMC